MAMHWNESRRGSDVRWGAHSGSALPGSVQKGYGTVSGLDDVRRVIMPGARALPRNGQISLERIRAHMAAQAQAQEQEARARAEASAREAAERAPMAFLLFLYQPGPCAVRELVRDTAGFLDEQSGHAVHWLEVGSPKRSGVHYRAYLELSGISFRDLDKEWKDQLDLHGEERDIVAVQTARLAAAYEVAEESLPALLVFVRGAGPLPFKVPIPAQLAVSVEGAREVLAILRSELASEAVSSALASCTHVTAPAMQKLMTDRVVSASKALERLVRQEQPKTSETSISDRRTMVVIYVANGMSVVGACERAVISRGAVYGHAPTKKLIAQARRSRARRGRNQTGVTEDEQDGGESEE